MMIFIFCIVQVEFQKETERRHKAYDENVVKMQKRVMLLPCVPCPALSRPRLGPRSHLRKFHDACNDCKQVDVKRALVWCVFAFTDAWFLV